MAREPDVALFLPKWNAMNITETLKHFRVFPTQVHATELEIL